MNEERKYKMVLSLHVLDQLGVNLYSNIPAVVSETIANAWDADATSVTIDIREENGEKCIVVTDNGCGMTVDDINAKFLTVGYHRRDADEGGKTPGGRIPMGRKGIGKLSLFSIAGKIEIHTVKQGGQGNALLLDHADIRKAIKSGGERPYYPKEIPFKESLQRGPGTCLVIRDLKKRITLMTAKSLRKRLARRFGVHCAKHMAIVLSDNQGKGKVTIDDRDYFHKLDYLFQYNSDHASDCANLRKEPFSRGFQFDEEGTPSTGGKFSVRGWIGLVDESPRLVVDGESINKISVMMREKLAVEDILQNLTFRSIFCKFLIGEIHADFLDSDDEVDLATANRERIVEHDPRYTALCKFLNGEITRISTKWTRLKREEAEGVAIQLIPVLKDWFQDMGKDARAVAHKMFGKINALDVDNERKKLLFAQAVPAFESYRIKENLNALENLSEDSIEDFLRTAGDLDNLEAVYYHQITTGRLGIIEALETAVVGNNLESRIRDYLFTHLWLLDPSWERGTEVKEKAISTVFTEYKATDGEGRGRVDIQFRQTAGVYVIVELKRPDVQVDSANLEQQVRKYKKAAEEHARRVAPEGRQPDPVEVVCILGKNPVNWDSAEEERKGRESLWIQGIRVLTYEKLIHDARKAYREYLNNQPKEKNRLLETVEKIMAAGMKSDE